MKHGKKPNVRQSIFLEKNGYNPFEWLVVKDTATEMWIVARNVDQYVITLLKDGSK